jgi:beta-lactamase regulating signal transducer with metallopeptidase domain
MIPSASQVLVESAARASIAATGLWIGLRLLRVANARVQKAAWTMVLAAAIVMPFLVRWQWRPTWAAVQLPVTSWSHWVRVHSAEKRQVQAAAIPALREESTITRREPAIQENFGVLAGAVADSGYEPSPVVQQAATLATTVLPASAARQTNNAFARIMAAAWFLYLSVCGALLLRLLWGLASTIRLWLQARPVEAGKLRVPAGIELRWSSRIASPVNIGSGILLPADYAIWDDEKLRVVLAHESAHVKQRDFYLQMVAGMYAAVTWLSPLGWWLKRKLAELGEAISDHAGLGAASSASAYAEVLLEFAALPRPTVAGVAMAHSTNLHQRIERLLNETSFTHAFAMRRRTVAVLVIPAVLIGASAFVRVEAATSQQVNPPQIAKSLGQQSSDQAQTPGESHPAPERVTNAESTQVAPAPASSEPAPAPAPAPSVAQTPQIVPTAPVMPVPLTPLVPSVPPVAAIGPIERMPLMPQMPRMPFKPGAFGLEGLAGIYGFDDFDGDPYAIVGDPGSKAHFSGDWDDDRNAEVEKARSVAHGHFLLFEHDGKYYVVDDPAIVSQLDNMEKAIADQREQMNALRKQMHEQAEQAREEARKARATVEKVPVPDIAKEMAELNAAVAALKADQGGTVSREQLAEIQRKLSEVQRRLMSVEVKVDVNMSMNQVMRQSWADEGKIGEQMGQVGAEIGRIARENSSKIRSTIDESLKNGKAKPVN